MIPQNEIRRFAIRRKFGEFGFGDVGFGGMELNRYPSTHLF